LATCFVIQPFDGGGKFDKRYTDVFEPAIRDAGLEPYRVDNDPAVSVPIEDIQNGIRRSTACLADVTLDNPNVWFELGYALASEKQICLVCSQERAGKYPFDVQHRSVIRYGLESKADFVALQTKITDRLRAIVSKTEALAIIEARSPIIETKGLLQHEIIVLASMVENLEGPGSSVSHGTLKEELARFGYNGLALNIGLLGLLEKHMIQHSEDRDYNGNIFHVYSIDADGTTWTCRNYERFNLETTPPKGGRRKAEANLDDDIPF
jgi:hypothetical protein